MAEMCSGSEAGSYLRRIDFVYRSTLDLRVITTPESQKGSPKVNFPLKAVVFKSGNRNPLRFGMNLPPPTLWHGKKREKV